MLNASIVVDPAVPMSHSYVSPESLEPDKRETGAAGRDAFRPRAAEGATGEHARNVLGPEAGRSTPPPRIEYPDGLAEQRPECNRAADNGAAARLLRAIDHDHERETLAEAGCGVLASRSVATTS